MRGGVDCFVCSLEPMYTFLASFHWCLHVAFIFLRNQNWHTRQSTSTSAIRDTFSRHTQSTCAFGRISVAICIHKLTNTSIFMHERRNNMCILPTDKGINTVELIKRFRWLFHSWNFAVKICCASEAIDAVWVLRGQHYYKLSSKCRSTSSHAAGCRHRMKYEFACRTILRSNFSDGVSFGRRYPISMEAIGTIQMDFIHRHLAIINRLDRSINDHRGAEDENRKSSTPEARIS